MKSKISLILKEKNATLYTIDAQKIANDVGLGGKINVIMEFLK